MVSVIGENSFYQPAFPLSYQELLLLVPEEIRNPKHEKHKKVYGLMQVMTRHLQDTRRVSTIPARKYEKEINLVPEDQQTSLRIQGIQQQMSAVRLRLSLHDYSCELERAILEKRLYELYDQAKGFDPDGVRRFERDIDKKMKKARNDHGNQ